MPSAPAPPVTVAEAPVTAALRVADRLAPVCPNFMLTAPAADTGKFTARLFPVTRFKLAASDPESGTAATTVRSPAAALPTVTVPVLVTRPRKASRTYRTLGGGAARF